MKNGLLKIIPIVLIGYFCFVAGRITSARRVAEPETLESITLEAQDALQNKYYGVAVKQFNRALAMQPNDAALHGGLGLALAQGGRTKEAVGEFEECLLQDPNRFDIAKQLGMALYKLDRLKEAKTRFETVISQRPNDAEAHEWLFTINNQLKKTMDNVPVLERLAELRPDDPQYIYAQVMVYHQNDQFDQALQTLEKLSPEEQKTSKARYVQAAIHVKQESFPKAIELLEQLVIDHPEHLDAKKLLDDTVARAGRTQKFATELAKLNQAIEDSPEDPESHFQLGYAMTRANRGDEATAAFNQALSKVPPTDVDTAKRFAAILYELERFDLAKQCLEQVADESKDIEIYERLLGIYTRLNKPLESIPILEKLAALNPEESKYVNFRMGIFVENNKPTEALQAFKSLTEDQQQEVKNQFILGVIYYQLEEHSKAAEVLEEVVRNAPDNKDAKKILDQIRALPGHSSK